MISNKYMYLYSKGIEFEGYSALANGEWEHLKSFNLYFGRDIVYPISLVSLNTVQPKLF
jgi:hypothetical protein